MKAQLLLALFVFLLTRVPTAALAQGPITIDDVQEGLPVISADEPLAVAFSPEAAAKYLDRSALNWQKTKKCATCHTNLFYMAARPALGSTFADSGEVRGFYEDYLEVRWAKRKPKEAQGFWPVVVGAGLTINDAQATGKLSDVAREVLDIVWTVQRADGGWKWPHCDYAPLEIDDHYGVTLAALAVGIAPDRYAETPQARAGLEKLRVYLKNNPPKSLHHRAMLAWCSVRLAGIATPADRDRALSDLLALQRDDGGWSTASFLSDWKELEPSPVALKASDGYGTGFVIVVARELGVSADDPRLKRGIEWLLTHQRASGKWFTRSPVHDCGNLLSNAGSAFAVLALQSCGHLPAGPFGASKPVAD